jgi:hypothetical protein
VLEAFADKRVDHLLLFCKDGDEGKDYLLAEAFTQGAKEDLPNIVTMLKTAREKTAPTYIHGNDNNTWQLVTKTKENDTRVMEIYNNLRFTQLAEKGLMNPYASTPKGLLHKREALAADSFMGAIEQAMDGAVNATLNLVELPKSYLKEVQKVLFNHSEQVLSPPG